MPRLSTVLGVSFLLAAACTDSRRGEKDAGAELGLVPLPPVAPPDTSRAVEEDAGTLAPDAPVVVDPSRLQEARALIPAPLLYGEWRPVVGTWVEYDVIQHEHLARLRVALVGESKRRDGTTLYQLEIEHDKGSGALVVLWLRGGARPFIERLAVTAPDYTPLSIPVDLHVDQPELRGTLREEKDLEVSHGLFPGKVHRRTFQRETNSPVVVTSTERAPLLGVTSIRDPEATWTLVATGTGAKPSLDKVPIAVPRVPGQ
ncbi:hypothetical protein MYSTI_00801 [Myxococcus stipitatus DSM 14675]|uniref:Lipoprotein n=1 Tax=Myxococcus stipitatus (strain DSM 14675 / JCM 12634 / Mx s8) TaxID=1278073 RepID=L7U2T4_MYXSD|nr:hypothetical protein [Myxococcus stipitatus]AGC42150.1 hypothetical protein MYSTI_00801 [Myxococcus stipitatus DSM 14675]